MSISTTRTRKEAFTTVDSYHRLVQRGPVRLPLGGSGEAKASGGGAKKSAERIGLDLQKHRFRGPLFTDPRRATVHPNA